ncbi:cysteine proteinase [Pisolithus croceorrhizus]|nr:cysteine proteinase [Pisolithus croceorrhizus]
MNPRKRKAPDSLLPTHRPPKHPRRHLRADWCNLFMDACELMRDTAVKGMETLIQLIPGSSKQPSETLYPTRPKSPHAEVSSPPQLSSPTESQELPARNDSSVPSNSTSFISSDTDGAPLFHFNWPHLRQICPGPNGSERSAGCRACTLNARMSNKPSRSDHVGTPPNKPHIYQRQHETRVRETRKQDRQKMLQELHEIKRQQAGKDLPRISNLWNPCSDTKKSSESAELLTCAQRSDYPSAPAGAHTAKNALTDTVPPAPPLLSRHERLREEARKKDEAIDRFIRPPLPKVLPPEIEDEVDAVLHKRGVISKIAREQTKILDVHYFSSFFWTKLLSEGYERARLSKWTKKLVKFDIFEKDMILIPVNHDNMHWTGAAINFREKRIESYDSMNVTRKLVFLKLRQYLDSEHRNKKGKPFDFTDWIDYDPEDTPQQENGYDCGVFTCQFLESLSRGEQGFKFSQRDMAYLRRRMIWEIAHAKFLSWQ